MTDPKDRKLDCRIIHDPRSANFRMGAAMPDGQVKSRRWDCEYRLDQGPNGMCVGFAGGHQIGASPLPQPVNYKMSVKYYEGAQKHDQWPGENYEGSSVLGLMKYWKEQGIISEYRWCFTLGEITETLALVRPINVGSTWPSGCNKPDSTGRLSFSGESSGGHSVLFDEVDFELQRIWVLNSWNRRWGIDGRGWLSFEDVEKMIQSRASFAVPMENPLPERHKKQPPWWSRFWPF